MKYKNRYESILTKDVLLLEYINNQKSPYDIAKQFKITANTVYKYLKLHNITQQDRTGQLQPGNRFEKLTLVKTVGKSKNGTLYWECLCDCGNITKVSTSHIKNGSIKSCGCLKKAKQKLCKSWAGYEEISGNFFSSVKCCANKRNILFDITIQDIWDKYVSQNKKCYLSGVDIDFQPCCETASVDRIDSSLFYTKDNIAISHKDINKIKSSHNIKDFINQCESVYGFNNNFKEIELKPIIYSSYFKDIISNAIRRGRNIYLTIEDIQKIYCSQGGICALSGVPIVFASNHLEYRQRKQTASVDRINNFKDYTIDNIQIVHKNINLSRKDLTIERYKELCKQVAIFNQNGCLSTIILA